ncbi:uncharacterized protein [Brachyistius frenatus]|uniref:uncharacterized protein n=1 Tax=Brachyistius frenatus TaxID=100188 RepID=UPI0037E902E7
MNWVGGSRNRLVMKNEAKKQREFFEKRKMQQKLKNMGIGVPGPSPGDAGGGSMDMVTLFIVNQIAAKKESKDPPKVAALGSFKRRSKHKRNEPLVLPMSPCSPSQLSLVDSQPQYSDQGIRKIRNIIPQGFKCRQLSPVLESAFSDNSASDYLAPRSPFSSTSSASSGQGIFPLQLNLQKQSQTPSEPPPHFSPPPWDTSARQQTPFQPFSQPRGMTDAVPWSCGSNPPPFRLETPTAAQVLFASPEPDKTEAGDRVTFSLNQSEDSEPMLDFMLNQSEAQQQFDEDVFRGFSNEKYEREGQSASQFGSAKSKIYLRDETSIKSSTPQTVPDSRCMGAELSTCTDMDFSAACLGHNTEATNGCECSPSYSCGGGYLSSDSNDEEDCCLPCLQTSASFMDRACSADSLNTNSGSQGNPKERLSDPRPFTPLRKPKTDFREDRRVLENVACPDEASKSEDRQRGGSTAPFLSPRSAAQTRSSETCKCKKTPAETRDEGTQTAPETCDASSQCSETRPPGFSSYPPDAGMRERRAAAGRKTDAAGETATLAASSGNCGSEGKQTPWGREKPKAGSLAGGGVINNFTASDCARLIPQRPTNPFLDALRKTDGRGLTSK